MNKQSIAKIFGQLLGQLQWSSPPWVKALKLKAQTNPKSFWGGLFGLLIILTSLYSVIQWYIHLPKPVMVIAKITAPGITPLQETLVPQPLIVDFVSNQGEQTPQSVAPLQEVGKVVTKGLTLTPKIPGEWRWDSDSRLVFTPETDWPSGQNYSIQFSKSFFASQAKMETLSYEFSTAPFQASIQSFEFYQDPVHPETRAAVATLSFNFPVDPVSLQEHIRLQLEALKEGKLDLAAKTYTYTLNYDEHKRTVYLRSENLSLPEVSRYLVLTLSSGIASASGSDKTQVDEQKNILLPDLGSFFKIQKTQASILRNPQDKPEQVLTIETSVGVTQEALDKGMHLYVLPKDLPATRFQAAQQNYQWQNPGEVTRPVLDQSKPLQTEIIPANRHYASLHSYKFKEHTPAYLYLKIDKGTKAFAGYVLSQDYEAIIQVPEFPQEINFLHKGALLALNSDKKLSVTVRGLSAVNFEVARVLPDNLNQLVTQTRGDFSNPYFINDNFTQQNIAVINSEIQTFANVDPAEPQYTALDFGKYLAAAPSQQGPNGLFLVKARGWDVENKQPLNVSNQRLILVTDLGLMVKDNNDGSHMLYVQSITQGNPVVGATVSVLGKNGLAVMTQVTDAQGLANFPNLSDYIDEKEPVAYLVNTGTDFSFIPYSNYSRQLNFSRFDVGGAYVNSQQPTHLSAYVFTDRGMYRPGESVHTALIVKQRFAQNQPEGLPLQASVTDPRGTIIIEKQFILNASGYLTLDIPTSSVSPTGQYQVNVYLMKDNRPDSYLGSTSFKVNEFLPDTMKIHAKFSQTSKAGWLSPDDLKAKVNLVNLYGTPATDRLVQGKIVLSPLEISFEKYSDYAFSDPLRLSKKAPKLMTETLAELHTDSKGMAMFDLNLNRFEQASYELTFFAEGFAAEGGRSVTTQINAVVSPLPYFIGYKTDGDLGFIKQHEKRELNYIAINPALEKIAVSDLAIERLKVQQVTALVKKKDGTYQYQSVLQKEVVDTTPFNLHDYETPYPLPTEEIGNYELRILNKDKQILSQVAYSVVGASEQPLPKNAELTVKLNKEVYDPGEEIELEITSPYTGAGLITIERDRVYAAQWFNATSTSSIQKIKIPADFLGNGYINVAFVRNWDSPEIFISPLSYSVEPFSISTSTHEVKIELNIPKTAMPGETLTLDYKTDKPAKIIIWGVDEGILQVARYQTPDPLGFFFDKQALQVSTQQILDEILPKYVEDRELSAVGGDAEEAELLASHLNPFKRKADLPVVYWSGIVDASPETSQLQFQIPDYFNGSMRFMAVAVADNAVGSEKSAVLVRGNFVITPNVPVFVAPGDEMTVTATIANNVKNSGEKASITVSIKSSSELEVLGDASQILTIPEGQEKSVSFQVKAGSIPNEASLEFSASFGDKESRIKSSLSVRPASDYLTQIQSGMTQKSSLAIPVSSNWYPQYYQGEALLATSPMILVQGLNRYLDNFPYGCTEQLVSKAMPLMAMASQPWFNLDRSEIAKKVNDTLQMLGSRQKTNGSFSYWPGVGSYDSDTFISIYAVQFLTEARDQGFLVPNNLLANGLVFLKDLSGQNPSNLEAARLQAYGIYILTRNEVVTTNYLTNLIYNLDQHPDWHWRKDLLGAYVASTFKLLQNTTEADQLITQYKPQSKSEYSDFYSTNLSDAQYLYLLGHHFPELLKTQGLQILPSLIQSLNTSEINTILASYSSLALAAYDKTLPKEAAKGMAINALLLDKQETTMAQDSNYLKSPVTMDFKEIRISNPGKLPVFYQIMQSGFEQALPKEPVSQGMEVVRDYRNAQGDSVTKARLGEELVVHMQIRSLNDDYLTNIALVDLLPGGFEVVRDSMKANTVNYFDQREDRVLFFLSVYGQSQEIVYKIKAVNAGNYRIPAVSAESMYNPGLRAVGLGGTMQVIP